MRVRRQAPPTGFETRDPTEASTGVDQGERGACRMEVVQVESDRPSLACRLPAPQPAEQLRHIVEPDEVVDLDRRRIDALKGVQKRVERVDQYVTNDAVGPVGDPIVERGRHRRRQHDTAPCVDH